MKTFSPSIKTEPVSEDLKGLYVMLGSPTYGPVEPDWRKSLICSLMYAGNHGAIWLGDSSTDKMGFSGARNEIAQSCLDQKGEADGVVWVDSDIIMPASAIWRLLITAKTHGFHILSGVYHQKAPPYKPVIYHYERQKDKFHQITEYEENQLIAPGGCGFGFVWTSYECLRTVSGMKDFEPSRGGWFPDTRHLPEGKGEDLAFCSKANRAGFEVWVDTGLQLEHAGGYKKFGRKDFLAAKAQVEDGTLKPPRPEGFGIRD